MRVKHTAEEAKTNPVGYPKPANVQLVRTATGDMIHVYDATTKDTLCKSGKNAGRRKQDGTQSKNEKQFFKSDATMVSCYRCSKLLSINEDKRNG